MSKIKTRKPELIVEHLGYGNTNQKAVTVEEFDFEAFEIILPPVTFAVIKDADYAHEIFEKDFSEEHWLALSEEEREAAIEKFEASDMHAEWQDGYNPMMLYFWPLFMHGQEPKKVAALLDQYAPCVTLIELNERHDLHNAIGEDYAFALSGGGMDLTDHLALAYICAGAVPPLKIITHAPDVIDAYKVPAVRKALRLALEGAARAVAMDLDRIKRAQKELRAKVKKANAEALKRAT